MPPYPSTHLVLSIYVPSCPAQPLKQRAKTGSKQNGATENWHIPSAVGAMLFNLISQMKKLREKSSHKHFRWNPNSMYLTPHTHKPGHKGFSSHWSSAHSLQSIHTALCQYYQTFMRSIFYTMRHRKTHPTGQHVTQTQQCPHKFIWAQTPISAPGLVGTRDLQNSVFIRLVI